MNPKVDDYIKGLDKPWQAAVVRKLRELVHKADPDITEEIKWGTPYFEHNGGVTWLFCATEWVHFSFPQGVLLDVPKGTWEEGPDTESKAKRTMKFREGQEIPEELIIRLVKQAVANNKTGKKVDFGAPKPGSRTFDVPHEYESFLRENGQLEAYKARPYYQQKGWVQWIEQAKQEETRQKRKDKMLEELQEGTYMPPKKER